jgi:adenine-specific DNA methylase
MNKVEYLEEQTFFNNGQFTEAEMDLINWGLNHLLQDLNSRNGEWYRAFSSNGESESHNEAKRQETMDAIEDLIEKLQEGS